MSKLIQNYKINLNEIESVEWKTQDSSLKSILFYKFNNENTETIEQFEKRIASSEYSICLVNSNKVTGEKIISIKNEDWNDVQKEVCDQIYPFDFESTKFVGITGTNGKTTTVDLIRQILTRENKKILTIGTLGVWVNDENISEFGLTSPSYIDFRKIIHKHSGQDYIACEVSSHALEQGRYYSVLFDACGWTSFSQDHLDYHKTLEEYFQAKAKIITKLKENAKVFISELDMGIIDKLESPKVQVVSSALELKNDYFQIEYNKKNLTIAIDILCALGVEVEQSYETLKPTPGRLNIFEYKNGKVVIDFAHTPDAIENVTKELKKTYPKQKLITVFGCGGNRDKTKRPLMAEAASKYSDFIFITSDNPRFEKPEDIIKDTEKGINNTNYEIEVDRSLAIQKAMSRFGDDIILIAGKGHENYIDQNGKKREYSDEVEVLKGIKNA